MSSNPYRDDECFVLAQKHCPFVEFIDAEGARHGFHAGQLLSYRLVTTDAEPPDTLEIASTTADIVITGWRLSNVADALRDGELLRVQTVQPSPNRSRNSESFSERYSSLRPPNPLVASVRVKYLNKAV